MKVLVIGCFSSVVPCDRSLTCPTHQNGEVCCETSSLLRSVLCTGGGRLGSFLQHSYSCSQSGRVCTPFGKAKDKQEMNCVPRSIADTAFYWE